MDIGKFIKCSLHTIVRTRMFCEPGLGQLNVPDRWRRHSRDGSNTPSHNIRRVSVLRLGSHSDLDNMLWTRLMVWGSGNIWYWTDFGLVQSDYKFTAKTQCPDQGHLLTSVNSCDVFKPHRGPCPEIGFVSLYFLDPSIQGYIGK